MRESFYIERSYRQHTRLNGLTYFSVMEKESDLYIGAHRDLSEEATKILKYYRGLIENYIRQHEDFLRSLIPVPPNPLAPPIIREMIAVSQTVQVGPMAAVAGAIAEFVGKDLLRYSPEIIVENGGDIYLNAQRTIEIGIFAGRSPLSEKLIITVEKKEMPLGVCTSSGTIGPSLSFGTADAVCVLSSSALLADAAATAIGNLVKRPQDINYAIGKGKKIPGIKGIIIIKDQYLGIWGAVNLKFT
ncbi:MAG: UPF0280 family protein [Syntrophales bacterium]|nr:UPF0280 family protein [Syntrophales bacterium]